MAKSRHSPFDVAGLFDANGGANLRPGAVQGGVHRAVALLEGR